ncbi:MAG: ABC transporter ATP-binding protein, partial [Deltaproteobacteria bacterium]|nr:ABC transporter ATP-binding protein [Deltaproteobacteria bacterium]
MIDKILGKDIGTYVKKHRLMMFYAILPAIITAMLAVVPVIITKSFIDEGIMKSGTSVQFTESAEPETYETQDKSAGSTESQVSAQEKMVKKYSSVVIRWLQILNIVDNPPPSMVMIILAAVAALAFLFQSITTYLSDLAAAAFSNRSIKDLRIDLHKKFMSLNQGFFDKNKAGLLISRSTADLSVMQNSISNITIGLVQYPLLILFFTVYLLIQNFRLTLIVFIAAPVILGLIHLFGRKVKKHSIRVQDATADVTSVYQETLLCLKIIQGFCTAENRSQKFREAADFLYKKTMHWNRWLRGMGPMMDATLFIILPAILIAGIL